VLNTVHLGGRARNYYFVTSVDDLRALTDVLLGHKYIILDCEGVPLCLSLIQIATDSEAYVIDSTKIGEQATCEVLAPLFSPTSTTTVIVHDLHMDALALHRHGIEFNCVLDTQLLHEHVHIGGGGGGDDLHIGLSRFLHKNGLPKHELKGAFKKQMDRDADGSKWAKRPLGKQELQYAVLDVMCLSYLIHKLESTYTSQTLGLVGAASKSRALHAISNGNGSRRVSFDCQNGYQLRSYELMVAASSESESKSKYSGPQEHNAALAQKLHTDESSMAALMDLIPTKFQELLTTPEQRHGLMDVVLDKQRRPQAFFGEQRMFLVEDESVIVEQVDIEDVVQQLGESNIGSDNRVGMDGSLNRISVIRNPRKSDSDSIIGLTMRVGRAITGNAAMIYDLLFSPAFHDMSILVVGEPGSGKTTIVREIARVLAEEQNVCIVDTSNEIAGDGDVPHHCVGLARRMMVPSLDTQSQVMVECVQNHTPHVMVIDEIGRPKEVDAARTVKQRGVRIVASAHGNFRSMMKNKQLKDLLGGSEQMIKRGGVPKTERVSAPTFEVVIEVQRKSFHQWVIIADVAGAVDRVLQGGQYPAQVRLRDPDSPNHFYMTLAGN
jgi:stage III sporulation protein SpoIIIAA